MECPPGATRKAAIELENCATVVRKARLHLFIRNGKLSTMFLRRSWIPFGCVFRKPEGARIGNNNRILSAGTCECAEPPRGLKSADTSEKGCALPQGYLNGFLL